MHEAHTVDADNSCLMRFCSHSKDHCVIAIVYIVVDGRSEKSLVFCEHRIDVTAYTEITLKDACMHLNNRQLETKARGLTGLV